MGKRLYMCLHAFSTTSKGIHHVVTDQKNKVCPLKKGRTSRKNAHRSAFKMSDAPARVVIAAAPMLIQYSGVRFSGSIGKNNNL